MSVIATVRAGMPGRAEAFVTQLSSEINFAGTMGQFTLNNTCLNNYLLRYLFVNSKFESERSSREPSGHGVASIRSLLWLVWLYFGEKK